MLAVVHMERFGSAVELLNATAGTDRVDITDARPAAAAMALNDMFTGKS